MEEKGKEALEVITHHAYNGLGNTINSANSYANAIGELKQILHAVFRELKELRQTKADLTAELEELNKKSELQTS